MSDSLRAGLEFMEESASAELGLGNGFAGHRMVGSEKVLARTHYRLCLNGTTTRPTMLPRDRMSELNPEVQERLHKAESENEVWKVLVIWYDAGRMFGFHTRL